MTGLGEQMKTTRMVIQGGLCLVRLVGGKRGAAKCQIRKAERRSRRKLSREGSGTGG